MQMTKERQIMIERIAESVRIECNVTDYGFKDIFESSEKLGYRIIRYPMGEKSFQGVALIKNNERIVFSNSSLILSREIFTIAHEIGHHKLHLSEEGLVLIKDDDLLDRDSSEIEANYFAACLLAPADKIEKFVRLELKDKAVIKWSGLDIARIQTAFSISYDMVLIRLRSLKLLDDEQGNKLKIEKTECSATKLLDVIGGNVDLCKKTGTKKIPAEFIEWVISNYNEKLIPKESLEKALKYVDLCVGDVVVLEELDEKQDTFEDLLRGME